jgi:hypothetical protein
MYKYIVRTVQIFEILALQNLGQIVQDIIPREISIRVGKGDSKFYKINRVPGEQLM